MLKKLRYPFLISVLGHLLLVLNVTYILVFKPAEPKLREMYLPAYIARPVNDGPKQEATMAQTPSSQSQTQQPVSKKDVPQKNKPTSKLGIEKPVTQLSQNSQASQVTLTNSAKRIASQSHPEREEAQNFSKQKSINKPLLKLLHDATAQHLVYPKIAADFNQYGRVEVGFMIYPNGQVSSVKVVKSSGYDMLDNEAMTAISAISPVAGVDQYIQKPEYVTAMIDFRLMDGNGTWAFNM